MRIPVRKVLVVDEHTNLRSLPPMEALWAAIISFFRDSRYYRIQQEKEAHKVYRAKSQEEENLKAAMLELLYREFTANRTAGKIDAQADTVTLAISRQYYETLLNIIDKPDFISYEVVVRPIVSDILQSFSKTMILVDVRRKVVK